MRVAAYCRVSTEKNEQLDSLEKQKEFFEAFAENNSYELYKLYADEGISGKQSKNRKQFQAMMMDARKRRFEKVIVKDVSRFARNTVDLLNYVRELKALGIEIEFVNNGKVLQGDSEFILTIYGAIAQEESANMSKRVKFGKSITAEKGRVPNIVFGYDKIPGEKYVLKINEKEAEIIRDIFDKYVRLKWGMRAIATYLNELGIRTKRNATLWSQNPIGGILKNALYTGRIINKKSEITDFITGTRRKKPEEEWCIAVREEMRIIDDETFNEAQKIIKSREGCFTKQSRDSQRHVFSKLIYCEHCGYSYLRQRRIYVKDGPEHVFWVCSGKHTMSKQFCNNVTTVNEADLEKAIKEYFKKLVDNKEELKNRVEKVYNKLKVKNDKFRQEERDLGAILIKLEQKKKKYLELYTDSIICKDELLKYTKPIDKEIEDIKREIKYITNDITEVDVLQKDVKKFIKNIEDLLESDVLTNEVLKRVIDKIVVDTNGNITVKLKVFTENVLDEDYQLGNVFP